MKFVRIEAYGVARLRLEMCQNPLAAIDVIDTARAPKFVPTEMIRILVLRRQAVFRAV